MKKTFLINSILAFVALVVGFGLTKYSNPISLIFPLMIFPILGISALIFYFKSRNQIGENKSLAQSFIFLLIGLVYLILLYSVSWRYLLIYSGQWGLGIILIALAFFTTIITYGIILAVFFFTKLKSKKQELQKTESGKKVWFWSILSAVLFFLFINYETLALLIIRTSGIRYLGAFLGPIILIGLVISIIFLIRSIVKKK